MANKFHHHIEARTPDPDCPGWDVLHLDCGHKSGAPADSRDFTTAHCGVCQLNSEAHARAIKQLQDQIAAKAAPATGGS